MNRNRRRTKVPFFYDLLLLAVTASLCLLIHLDTVL